MCFAAKDRCTTYEPILIPKMKCLDVALAFSVSALFVASYLLLVFFRFKCNWISSWESCQYYTPKIEVGKRWAGICCLVLASFFLGYGLAKPASL